MTTVMFFRLINNTTIVGEVTEKEAAKATYEAARAAGQSAGHVEQSLVKIFIQCLRMQIPELIADREERTHSKSV